MLAPHYRYIALDFETTGLDIHNDEPIQIGIAEIDENGKFVAGFQSLLRPLKSPKQLKSIVGFITGLSVDDLQSAPSPAEVIPEIQHFFGERTIIIGHNIGFDLAFLKKFFPTLSWKTEIDTFRLSQDLMHYVPSYAQEILIQQLQIKPEFQQKIREFGLEGELAFHDAFFDAKLSLILFLHLIQRVQLLCINYPILYYFLNQSSSGLKEILSQKEIGVGNIGGLKNLPPLKKIAPSNTQLQCPPYQIQFDNLPNKGSFHVQNLSLKNLLATLATQKRVILSFSTKPKLDIAKNLLNELGIKNLGFAKEEQVLNSQAVQNFVNKPHFTEAEFSFLLKYFSHLEQGLGVLDLNSKENYEIYTALKDQRATVNYPVILTTHSGLFSLLEQGERYKDYTIYFFDASWWYKSFNFYLSRPYDLNYTLNYLDMLCYKYGLKYQYNQITEKEKNLIEEFRSFFIMFIGILGQETKKFFINTDATQTTLSPIVGNIAFYQTNKLLSRFAEYKLSLQELFSGSEIETLWKQIEHMERIFESTMIVEKKMYEKSAFNFIYAEEVNFTNRTDFLQIFSAHKTLFLSNISTDYPALLPVASAGESQERILSEKIFHLTKIPSIMKALETSKSEEIPNELIFILSVKKDESKQLFEAMIEKGLDQDFMLLVENITGGSGKNLFKAKQHGKKIVIGGYNFLLQLFAQKLAISKLIVYNSKGKEQNLIFNDILRYGRENLL